MKMLRRGIYFIWDSIISNIRGLRVTLRNFVMRKTTICYPYERREMPPRYRGLFYLKWNEEKQRLNCIGCTLCVQACPTNVISMVKLGKGTHAGVSDFRMDLGRCLFCNLCVEACPFDAIYMGPKYELASSKRDACVFNLVTLAQGGEDYAKKNIETITKLLSQEETVKPA
ncbi:MAG: NADH-quinone oxidoreductase subunit I [bacterium]